MFRTKLASALRVTVNHMNPATSDESKIKEPCHLSFDGLRSLADELVIAHLRAGHGDALGVLFDRYHRLVLHVALKILHDVGEAEDVMQNVFMEIYKVAAQFDPARGTTKMWILRYAYHRSMNRRKQLQIRHFYASTDITAIEDILLTEGAGIPASYEAREVIQRPSGAQSCAEACIALGLFRGTHDEGDRRRDRGISR